MRLVCGLLLAALAFAQEPISVPQADAGQAKGRRNGLYATLNTSMGPIIIQLYEKEAPETVRNFVLLSMGGRPWRDPRTKQVKQTPLYPGTIFHRVIPNFMIQGGDPLGTGTGDGGYVIPDEWHRSVLGFNTAGRVAMANSGPKTTSTQFFITETPVPHLDGKHTIFGQLVDGLGIVYKIARVPRDANDKPRTPVYLESVQIYRVGPEPAARKPRK